MDVQIKSKPAFTVLGIEGCGDAEKGPEWIEPLWTQMQKRFREIKDLAKDQSGPPWEYWGLMSATDEFLAPWKKEGKYLAGLEVKHSTKPPKGWKTWDILKQTYAVVACTMATYREAYQFVVQQFLPREGYRQAGAMHEFYPKESQDPEKATLYLYFLIKKKKANAQKSAHKRWPLDSNLAEMEISPLFLANSPFSSLLLLGRRISIFLSVYCSGSFLHLILIAAVSGYPAFLS